MTLNPQKFQMLLLYVTGGPIFHSHVIQGMCAEGTLLLQLRTVIQVEH